MSNARIHFYETIGEMRHLSSDPSFIDGGPTMPAHNIRARILRGGLTVSVFALLELYLEERLSEVLRDLSTSRIGYNGFNEDLRSFFTVKAIQGLANQLNNNVDKPFKLSFAEFHIQSIAKVFDNPVSYTAFGFSPTGSNIKSDDVKDLPKLFGMTGGWPKLGQICRNIGIARIDLSADFANFIKARNKSAHDITSNIPSLDLSDHIQTALIIGLSCDIAITHCINCFVKASTQAEALKKIELQSIDFRYLDQLPGAKWAETTIGGARNVKIYPSFDAAKSGALGRGAKAHLIVRDLSKLPTALI